MPVDKTIQTILRDHYPAYARQYKQSLRVIKAIAPQCRCRTKDQGISYYRCPNDKTQKEIYHSCRHKGCTICGNQRQSKWLDTQKQRLINCGHFHLVFTLPHEYQALWLYNRKWFIDTHFKVVSETLNHLLVGNTHKNKHFKGKLNAVPGFISTLHTWGRSLNLHPHIHVLITSGGLNKNGKWIGIDNDFLLPVRQVKSLYRGKFQDKIKAFILSHDVCLPPHQTISSLLKVQRDLLSKKVECKNSRKIFPW